MMSTIHQRSVAAPARRVRLPAAAGHRSAVGVEAWSNVRLGELGGTTRPATVDRAWSDQPTHIWVTDPSPTAIAQPMESPS